MQQHPIEYRARHHVPACRSFVPVQDVENGFTGSALAASLRHQERDSNQHAHSSQHLRRSQFLAWQSSPRRRVCVLSYRSRLDLPDFSISGKNRPAGDACSSRPGGRAAERKCEQLIERSSR